MRLRKLFTLMLVRRPGAVLLGWKKRGFGTGKWNGFGGKLEPGESVRAAAVRELQEECGLRVSPEHLKNVGHLEFTFEGDPQLMEVHVFTATVFEGTPVETEEMRPKWFPINVIPYASMWPDDKLWFPYLLNDKLFYGSFHYKGHDLIAHYDLKEIDSIEKFYAECDS